MIKLIDLLEGVNNNELYHWTSYTSCIKIIESNKLKSNNINYFFNYDKLRILPEYKNVIFFTQDNNRFGGDDPTDECILVLDKQKILKDYKVISYGDPYEETVLYTNDPYIPILYYLKEVILMNTLQKSKVKKTVSFLKEKNIPYKVNNDLEKKVKEKQSELPILKKEFINKLIEKYPKGIVGYLNKLLFPFETKEYFKSNPTYSYPSILIDKPLKKNKFQVKFIIKPQDYDKVINWYMYSLDDIEKLLNLNNYSGIELNLKGDIKIDSVVDI
jgi:hypothetical protein